MSRNFFKMHGAGNDFLIMLENTLEQDEITRLSNRHTGVGFDQAIFAHKKADNEYSVTVYNADGTIASFCGNGFRCLTALIGEKEISLHTASGIVKGYCTAGQANIQFPKAPILKEVHISNIEKAFVVNTGNEHCACLNASNWDLGELYQHCTKALGKDVNVFSVNSYNSESAAVRCYERGAGETQACGSGAMAVSAVLMKNERYSIQMPGGTLTTILKKGEYYQSGPTEFVFEGNLALIIK